MNTKESFHLNDRVVVLTGGAGLYGRTLAAQLAEAGATLVLASRNVTALQQVADEEKARGFKVTAQALDQGDNASIDRLLKSVLETHGRVDGLVNNAVWRPNTAVASPQQAWEESMKVNALGLHAITRAFGDAMAARGSGSIVNVGSIYGMLGPTLAFYEGTDMGLGAGDYNFHKGGMINLTRYFAAIYGPRGVRVNCVSPGGFFNNQPKLFLDRYNRKNFLGRMAGQRDLGGPVVFLLAEASSYVTGTNLPVDGGFTAQ